MKKHLLSAMLVLAAIALQSQTIIYVKPDGSGDGSSWDNACNLDCVFGRGGTCAVPAETNVQIRVQKGTYYPSAMLTIPASVKMYGGFSGTETDLSQRDLEANPTVLDAQKKFGSVVRLNAGAELNGFIIQNGSAQNNPNKNGGGVWADDNTVVEHCTIVNNSAYANGGGIYAKGVMKIIACVVTNNTASGEGANAFGNCIIAQTAPIINRSPSVAAQSKQQGTAFPALSVSAIGDSPLSYQWYSDTVNNNTNGTLISDATNASYTPLSTTVGTMYYYCKVSNSHGSAVSAVSGAQTVNAFAVAGCSTIPWDPGTVSFSAGTDIIITGTVDGKSVKQIWSRPVMASNCKTNSFNGGSSDNYLPDCRRGRTTVAPGDYFSWCAVAVYADQLCPEDWRTPTIDDFILLDRALNGGTGAPRIVPAHRNRFINIWGSTYSESVGAPGTSVQKTNAGWYWTSQECSATSAYCLKLHKNGDVFYPTTCGRGKTSGILLRCVK